VTHPEPHAATVLVVEDEPDIGALLGDLLESRGYRALVADDGRAALRLFHERRPDLVVLDLGLPGMDGWETLHRIRDLSDAPVLILTARAAEEDKVRALHGGADDYMVKPFGYEELFARLAVLLRRSRPVARDESRYEDADLVIDPVSREVTYQGRRVELTPLEYRLLTTLARHPRKVLSREQLLELVWDDPYAVSRDVVRIYIGYLRRKLGADVPIETVRGFGYCYRPRHRAAVTARTS